MTGLAVYPDSELAVIDLLAPFAKGGAGGRTYATVTAGPLPYIRVLRTGGSDDGVTDMSRVSVGVFSSDPDEAKALARQCQQRLLSVALPGGDGGTAHGAVDRAVTDLSPQLVTAPDIQGLQLAVASYRVTMRR